MNAKESIVEYKRLLVSQAALPEGERWRMGESIRRAKAQAYVEIEYEKCFKGQPR